MDADNNDPHGYLSAENVSAMRPVLLSLGRIGHKLKYALVDHRDAVILENKFRVLVLTDYDKNGNGAVARVWMHEFNSHESRGSYLNDYMLHGGSTPENCRIIHRNGIGFDNRLCNLDIVPESEAKIYIGPSRESLHNSLYYKMLTVVYHVYTGVSEYLTASKSYAFDGNGDLVRAEELLFECNFLPCVAIESQPCQFKFCKYCLKARYCSAECMENDFEQFHTRICSGCQFKSKSRTYHYLIQSPELLDKKLIDYIYACINNIVVVVHLWAIHCTGQSTIRIN